VTLKRRSCLACLGALILFPVLRAADPPQAEIANSQIRAKLYLPDPVNGYYQATRFDWSGQISSLTYKGHEYYGQWFEKWDPKKHDSIMGPVQEYVTPLGYEKAAVGGTFVKIGVGVLRKPTDAPARGFPLYEIVDSGKWTVVTKPDYVQFTHQVSDPSSGYSYEYTKTVRLVGDKPQMVLEQSLKNTGKEPIVTDMYDHNFFVIDHTPAGPDFTVTFPFQLTATSNLNGWAEVRGNQLVYLKEMGTTGRVRTELKGFGNTPKDYDIKVENTKTGAGARITSDQPLSNLVFWSSEKPVCPEAYIHLDVKPGQESKWRITYDYYTLPGK
jgi:hypothetical protein